MTPMMLSTPGAESTRYLGNLETPGTAGFQARKGEKLTHTERFRRLHDAGSFVMPNPWDLGSARVLEEMGFPALATTSAGLGRAIGKDDQQVTREELVEHVAALTDFIGVPLNVDSERLFPGQPGGIVETVRMLADSGAAGCSIEDYDPASGSIDTLDASVKAVSVAAEACRSHGMVLTARAENYLYGVADIDDTIKRLSAYRAAGAEVLYAPGLTDEGQIARVVELGAPINVLALATAPPLSRLTQLGVRRISTGSALYNEARAAFVAAAEQLLTG